jgi:predicted S18 family serine protease
VTVLSEDKFAIEQIESIYDRGQEFDLTSNSGKNDLFALILLGYEKFKAIGVSKLWDHSMSHSTTTTNKKVDTETILNEKELAFHQSIYQDYSLLFLELLSNLFSNLSSSADLSLCQRLKTMICEETRLIQDCHEIIREYDFIHRLKREKEVNKKSILSEFQKEFIKSTLQLLSHLFYQNSSASKVRTLLFLLLFFENLFLIISVLDAIRS